MPLTKWHLHKATAMRNLLSVVWRVGTWMTIPLGLPCQIVMHQTPNMCYQTDAVWDVLHGAPSRHWVSAECGLAQLHFRNWKTYVPRRRAVHLGCSYAKGQCGRITQSSEVEKQSGHHRDTSFQSKQKVHPRHKSQYAAAYKWNAPE